MNYLELSRLIFSVLGEMSTSYEAVDNSCFKTVGNTDYF